MNLENLLDKLLNTRLDILLLKIEASEVVHSESIMQCEIDLDYISSILFY